MSIAERLKSRKLWITVAGVAYFLLQGNAPMAGNLVLAYLAAQGLTDAAGAFRKG